MGRWHHRSSADAGCPGSGLRGDPQCPAPGTSALWPVPDVTAMLESLLIANRGEIARRIIRSARRLGIRSIAVHSTADAGMPFVREADQALCIGGAAPAESYLAQDKLLAAAQHSGAQGIHPGYGFLSENADFAQSVI